MEATASSRLLHEKDAAVLLGLSPKTLSRWRWAGRGPQFLKLGGAVRYQRSDLEVFLAASARRSTSARGLTSVRVTGPPPQE